MLENLIELYTQAVIKSNMTDSPVRFMQEVACFESADVKNYKAKFENLVDRAKVRKEFNSKKFLKKKKIPSVLA